MHNKCMGLYGNLAKFTRAYLFQIALEIIWLPILTAAGFLEGRERAQIYNKELGERSVLLSMFRDKYSEELAYPGIFLGQKGQRMTML